MDFLKIINLMKEKGVCFSSGLTNETLAKVEKTYDICFPDSLKAFYLAALPISVENTVFEEMKVPYIPRWSDILDSRR